ncbi:MAG: polyketide synthase, partial [Deltaproteobacteria bacterium]|nr:polyketide synthase [Deltaproteobacteria bacterium]
MSDRYNVAIVGMGCILPGAKTIDQYWRNICSGETFFTDMPKDRWDFDRFWSSDVTKPNKTYSRIGAFITDFDFPFLDYKLPPNLMHGVDLTQLVTLEATKQALEDAGLKPRDERLTDAITVLGLSGVDEWARLTVFLRRHDFLEALVPRLHEKGLDPAVVRELAEEFGEVLDDQGYHYESATAAVGAVPSSVSNRVAQVFGIRGFNMSIDAACASSMAAVQTACDALRAGDARIAVAGGADLGINPAIYIGFSRVMGMSQSGKSNPFDDSADGLLIGEGVGILVLKKLEDALEDGDRIHAVIQGIGSSSDGAGNAIYAPSAEGRAECMRRALEIAGRRPSEIRYIEAHATSTVVGDGNEIDAMGMAYGQHADPDRPVALGSVKGQIGHLKAAAGSTSLIKTTLCMEHGLVPHMPRFKTLTTEATYSGGGLYIPTEMEPWEPDEEGLRIAAVTSSGFGGINYQVILEMGETYDPPPPRTPIDRRLAIVGISCRTPGASDPEEFIDHLMAGDELFTPAEHESLGWHTHVDVPGNESITAQRIGRLEDWEPDLVRYRIFPNAKSQISEAQILGLELTDELLEIMDIDRSSPKHIAVSIGSMHNDHFGAIWMNMLDDVYREAVKACKAYSKIPEGVRDEVVEGAVEAFMKRFPPSTEHTLPGWMSNCLSGRIANTFNFNGPNFVVDSACSSGVSAFVPAMYELAFGRSEMAVAGGINRSHNAEMAIGVTSLGAVSDDVARPFDVEGHGFLMSEGGGLFLLKRLEDARKNGDAVLGIIRGISGSSEADSKSMVAPTKRAVRRALRKAVDQAGVDESHIGVVDVHGSANHASDVVEVQSLAEELRPEQGGSPLLVTAVKSHIGHLYGGSGVTSAISVLGSLNRGQAPGIRNLVNPIPEAVEVQDRALPIPTTRPLPAGTQLGAVQSLGLGGANFVMIMEPGTVRTTIPPGPGRGPKRERPPVPATAPPPVVSAAPAPNGAFPSLLTVEAPEMEGVRRLLSQASSDTDSGSILSEGFDAGLRVAMTHASQEDLDNKLNALTKVLEG